MNDIPINSTVHDGAVAMLRAGNSLEAVAAFFGMSVAAMRTLAAQPLTPHPVETPAVPVQPWHQFPTTIVFRRPNMALMVMLVIALAAVAAVGWSIFSPPRYQGRIFISLWALFGVGYLIALVRAIRAGWVNRFEMRPYTIARYTRQRCTVLRYVDIVGYTINVEKGDYAIQFLTSRGVALSIIASPAQLDHPQFAAWLHSLPGSDDTLLQSHPGRLVSLLPGLAACLYMLATVPPAVTAMHDTAAAKSSLQWPATDGIVTESVPLTGGRHCSHILRMHNVYAVAQYRYTGNRYQFGTHCIDDAVHIAAADPVGKHIPVHYRLDNPADSVIAPGIITRHMVLDLFEMVLFVMFPAVVFRYSRQE